MRLTRFFILAIGLLVAACTPIESDGPREQLVRLKFQVTVPESAGTVYLTGNLQSLGPWRADGVALIGDGTVREVEIELPKGHRFEYKYTAGSWAREATDAQNYTYPNYVHVADVSETVTNTVHGFKDVPAYIADVAGADIQGDLTYWLDMPSQYLSETRHVSIWTPPGYAENTAQSYRVIYMSDGQNLFDPRIANTGSDWGVDEAMLAVAERTGTAPAIVVASWSTAQRGVEYSPWHNADGYAAFIIDELMPRIEAGYRVKTGAENTFHMGSSMGGLLSFYMVMTHSDLFGACGCLSTHVSLSPQMAAQWFADTEADATDATPYIVRDLETGLTPPEGVRFWFDYGTRGLDAEYGPPHAQLEAWLQAHRRERNVDYVMRVYDGADHNEAAWRDRLVDPLTFLLAPEAYVP